MTFTLPALPYDYDAFGHYISSDIMRLHHDNHHQTYVDKLNAALDQHTELDVASYLVGEANALNVEAHRQILQLAFAVVAAGGAVPAVVREQEL